VVAAAAAAVMDAVAVVDAVAVAASRGKRNFMIL